MEEIKFRGKQMTLEEKVVEWAYDFTDYIGYVIGESKFDKAHEKYGIDSDHVRNYLIMAFIAGAEWQKEQNRENTVSE